jgi:hypothetical protein
LNWEKTFEGVVKFASNDASESKTEGLTVFKMSEAADAVLCAYL